MTEIISIATHRDPKTSMAAGARLDSTPDAHEKREFDLKVQREILVKKAAELFEKRRNRVIPSDETQSQRLLREYRENWKPFDLCKIGLSNDEVASMQDENNTFRVQATIKYRPWTVNGHGAWEVGTLGMHTPLPFEGHYFVGLNEFSDSVAIPVVDPVHGKGENQWVAYAYPLGHLDEVVVLDLTVDGVKRVDWYEDNSRMMDMFTSAAPTNVTGTDNPVRICEYLKDNGLEVSMFAWHRAMRHDLNIYTKMCSTFWAHIDAFIASHPDIIREAHEAVGGMKPAQQAMRRNLIETLVAAPYVSAEINNLIEEGKSPW